MRKLEIKATTVSDSNEKVKCGKLVSYIMAEALQLFVQKMQKLHY